jgi:hypothetical protein
MNLQLAPFSLALAISAPLFAQQRFTVLPCGGGLGKSLTVQLKDGPRLRPYFLLTSMIRTTIPLKLIDPNETRSLGLGLELPQLWFQGLLGPTGGAKWVFPVPNDPNLLGKGLLQQAFTFPGKVSFFDALSEVSAAMFEKVGSFRKPSQIMGHQRSYAEIIPLGGGQTLVVGGGNGGFLSLVATRTTEIFDELNRKFRAGPSMNDVRALGTTTLLLDGRTLLTGGVDVQNDPQKACEVFDPKKGVFLRTGAMAFKRMGQAATRLKDGRVLVTGGLSDLNNQLKALGSALKETELYDPKTGKWTRGPNMKIPRAGQLSFLLPNGKVLIAGGITWTSIFFLRIPSITKTCEIFDPKTNQFSSAPSMLTERAVFQAAKIAGKIYVAGGSSGSITSGGAPTKKAEAYDMTTGKWGAIANMSSARGLATSFVDHLGRFVNLGGAQGSLLNPKPIKMCEVFDPKTGKWVSLPNLNLDRAGSLGFRANACGWLVIGGGSGISGQSTRTIEIFLPR